MYWIWKIYIFMIEKSISSYTKICFFIVINQRNNQGKNSQVSPTVEKHLYSNISPKFPKSYCFEIADL